MRLNKPDPTIRPSNHPRRPVALTSALISFSALMMFGGNVSLTTSVATSGLAPAWKLDIGHAQAADNKTPLGNRINRRGIYQCERDRIPVPYVENSDGRANEDFPVEIEADSMEPSDRNVITLKGNAQVVQGTQMIGGESITYDKGNDTLKAEGDVVIYTPLGDRLNVDNLEIELESFVGEASNVRYRWAERDVLGNVNARRVFDPQDDDSVFLDSNFSELTEGDFDDRDLTDAERAAMQAPQAENGQSVVRARGTAGKVYLEGHDLARMEDVTYTTCVEGQDDVIIRAGELELDQGNNVGTARNVTLRFKDVPIFYLPYVTFPISNERKTGFLFPGIGRDSESGLVVEAPWYWNIAPNLDATITPRWMQDRGVQLAGEFRYLTERGQGVLRGEVLPSDDLYGDDRSAFSYRHDHRFTERLTGYIDVQHASDDDYFDDFETDVNVTSTTHLPERAQLAYRGDVWNVTALVAGYQTLDDSIDEINRPYDRLPQITFNGSKSRVAGSGFKLDMRGEVVRFDRDAGVTGTRIDLTHSVSYPIRPVYGFVIPKLALRSTKYSLDNNPDGDDSPDRHVPIFSVDSGLYFERGTTWGGKSALQTLEPRLFYVYIPDEDQDSIPTFDTSEVSLNSMSALFRDNRFFGADRVGDTNQLTLGLTTRILDSKTGRQKLSASIGQAFFLEDRFVTLDDSTRQDRSKSNFLAELDAQFENGLRTRAFLEYDTEESEISRGRLDLDYTPGDRKRIGIGYRYSGDFSEQLNIDVDWGITPRWDFHLRERYDIDDSKNLETTIGFGYDACCWGIDFVYQRRLDRGEEYKNAFYMIFELTGLGRVRAGL